MAHLDSMKMHTMTTRTLFVRKDSILNGTLFMNGPIIQTGYSPIQI